MKKSKIIGWFNKGTKGVVCSKRILFILLSFLFLYRIGYIIGVFMANLL